MVINSNKPFFMMLRNIKKNAPHIFFDSAEYLKDNPTEDMSMEFNAVCWNKNTDQTYFFYKKITAQNFIADVKNIIDDKTHKHRLFCNKTMLDFLENRIKGIKDEWLKQISTQKGIIHLTDSTALYIVENTESEMKFNLYWTSNKKDSDWLGINIHGRIRKEDGDLAITSYLGPEITNDEGQQFSIKGMSCVILRILFFLEYAEVETKIVNHKNRRGVHINRRNHRRWIPCNYL